jgi:MFS transporter, PAT family, beta-lactamase induction signal transducer AmpG
MTGSSSAERRPPRSLTALFLLLGFSAGLPLYLYTSVLFLRLARNGVDLTVIGFFVWAGLLPSFKFLWAPAIDRLSVPGFARFWGRKRGWVMLSQLGIAAAMLALGLAHPDTSLPLTALCAVLLAFWTTTLEIAADGWRVQLAPDAERQAPLVTASLWGYRGAMVAAGSGALFLADGFGWTAAYAAIAAAALLPFPLLVAMRADREGTAGRMAALATGLFASVAILILVALAFAGPGIVLLALADAVGLGADSNVTPALLVVAMLPFIAMALALPRIVRLPPDAPLLRSPLAGPYVELFRHYGAGVLAILAFVSLYRMGDVLALTLSKPLVNALGYSLSQIAFADGVVALAGNILGVGAGGMAAARLRGGWPLAIGALLAAIGNVAFAWLATQPMGDAAIVIATALDQFGNGFAGAVFVVYLSLLVNPLHAGAQYALLSGVAFLLPRLIAGASGGIEARIGYPGFFLLSGALSLAAIALLPLVGRARRN